MPKIATHWKPTDSGTSVATNEGYSLLLETNDYLLTETSFFLLLESSVVSTKNPTDWNNTTKNTTSWKVLDGYTTYGSTTTDTLVTQSGDTIITQSGDTRIFQPSDDNPKLPTRWAES